VPPSSVHFNGSVNLPDAETVMREISSRADLDTLLERLPHERVAVQWDIAVEMGALEGAMGVTLPMEQIAPGHCPVPRARARRYPGRTAPLLRRLRPPALEAA
jgi:hypothetical protein